MVSTYCTTALTLVPTEGIEFIHSFVLVLFNCVCGLSSATFVEKVHA